MRTRRQAVLGAKLDCEEDSTQLWMEPGGFGSLVECAKSWLVQMSSGRLPSSVLFDKFGSLGINIICSSYWGTLLDVMNCGRDKFIPVCGLLGGGL
ncbi:hypothetical protein DEO72_LG6g2095 [Vigna unguiculata]|uniref:Uncharacterized protein n=1 Tax=Vigna unguiculata TaxID=3917 RepID=A0A4D6M800_VIGUN|nr:hypothetical protein DEO72_LG6g2095 [Vigna unguiculata]